MHFVSALLCLLSPALTHAALTLTYQRESLNPLTTTPSSSFSQQSYPITTLSILPFSRTLTGAIVDFSTGCTPISFSHIPSQYDLIALLDLSEPFDFETCNSYSQRLNNTLAPRVIGVIYNPPTSFDLSAFTSTPLFRFEASGSYAYDTLVAATLGTLGVSDFSREKNTQILTCRIANDGIDSSYIWKVAIGSGAATLAVMFTGLMVWYRRSERMRRLVLTRQIELLRRLQFERDERVQMRRPTLAGGLLGKIKVVKFSEVVEVKENGQCAVCLEYFKGSEDVRQLGCGHTFHLECIDEWLVRRSVCCPLCRVDVRVGMEGVVIETDDDDHAEAVQVVEVVEVVQENVEENQFLEPGSASAYTVTAETRNNNSGV